MTRRCKSKEAENPFQEGNGPEYIPARDGSIDDYLQEHDGRTCTPLFRGAAVYAQLKEGEYLKPMISYVRLMWNEARGDEHFYVTDDYKLEAAEAGIHSGREGIHDPTDILKDEGPLWEAHGLRRHRNGE